VTCSDGDDVKLHPVCEPCKLGDHDRCWGEDTEAEWWAECACADAFHMEEEDAEP